MLEGSLEEDSLNLEASRVEEVCSSLDLSLELSPLQDHSNSLEDFQEHSSSSSHGNSLGDLPVEHNSNRNSSLGDSLELSNLNSSLEGLLVEGHSHSSSLALSLELSSRLEVNSSSSRGWGVAEAVGSTGEGAPPQAPPVVSHKVAAQAAQ